MILFHRKEMNSVQQRYREFPFRKVDHSKYYILLPNEIAPGFDMSTFLTVYVCVSVTQNLL